MSTVDLLSSFGLDEKEGRVYLGLTKLGWTTILDLSRRSQIKRSSLYRVIERLVAKGLVEVKPDEFTTYYRCASTEVFEAMIAEQKYRVRAMDTDLQLLRSQLKLLQSSGVQETGVRFHRGPRGIQVLELKIVSQPNLKLRILGTSQWHETVGRRFAEEIRQKELERGITVREITNPGMEEKIPLSGQIDWTDNVEFVKRCYRHRQISRKEIAINNEITVLPEALVLYSITADEVVGIEIQSTSYAKIMAGLFDGLWERAQPIDSFG